MSMSVMMMRVEVDDVKVPYIRSETEDPQLSLRKNNNVQHCGESTELLRKMQKGCRVWGANVVGRVTG